jgi:DNA-binding transcriptional ArsR family regulator
MVDDRKTQPELGRARSIGAEAMKAFAHPLRMAMYDLLSQRGTATATTLARELGESTGQTSYHLRQLERHGFVAEDAERGTGRERWWRPVGFSMQGVDLAKDPSTAAQVELMLRTQVEEQMRDKTRWLRDALDEDPAWVQASLSDRSTVSMTAEEMRDLSAELQRVMRAHFDRASAREDVPDERRVRIYLDLIPLPRSGQGSE